MGQSATCKAMNFLQCGGGDAHQHSRERTHQMMALLANAPEFGRNSYLKSDLNNHMIGRDEGADR